MNSLSWLIYMAQVLTSLGYLFVFLGCVALALMGAGVVLSLITSDSEYDKKTFATLNKRGHVMLWVFTPLMVIFITLGNTLPNKDTLYAIAASQLGEQIVASGEAKELANDAYAALRVWLKKQIADDKPGK